MNAEHKIDELTIMVSKCKRCNGAGVIQGLQRWDYSYEVHQCPKCDPLIMLDGSVYDPFPPAPDKVEPGDSALAKLTSGLIMATGAVAMMIYLGII